MKRSKSVKCKTKTVGYAVREVDGLRSWYQKKNEQGVYFDSSREKAKVYRTKQGATSLVEWLNRRGFKYKDGTGFRFEVVPIFAI